MDEDEGRAPNCALLQADDAELRRLHQWGGGGAGGGGNAADGRRSEELLDGDAGAEGVAHAHQQPQCRERVAAHLKEVTARAARPAAATPRTSAIAARTAASAVSAGASIGASAVAATSTAAGAGRRGRSTAAVGVAPSGSSSGTFSPQLAGSEQSVCRGARTTIRGPSPPPRGRGRAAPLAATSAGCRGTPSPH